LIPPRVIDFRLTPTGGFVRRLRAIAQQSQAIRLPIHITEKLNKIKKQKRQLAQNWRTATVNELAVELKLTPTKSGVLSAITSNSLVRYEVGDDQDTELGELLEDTAASTDDYIKQASLQADLEQLMADLTLQQRQILSLRFGLEDGQPYL